MPDSGKRPRVVIIGGGFAGVAAAKNILRDLRRQPRKIFHYFNKGDLATIGRSRAIADFGKVRFTGRLAPTPAVASTTGEWHNRALDNYCPLPGAMTWYGALDQIPNQFL